jgi:hypothetical protein
MSQKKRSLKLLPEVLPAPPSPARATSPRERTLLHMRRLVAATAVVGGATGAGCSKPETPVKDVPPPPNDGTVTGMATAPPKATDTTPTTTVTAPVGPPPTYAVVDPMPPPAMCNIATVTASAKWDTVGKTMTVVVGSTSAQVKLVPPKESPVSAMGAKITSQDLKDGKVVAKVEVEPNAKVAEGSADGIVLSVRARCPGWATLNVTVTIGAGAGKPLSVRVDSY